MSYAPIYSKLHELEERITTVEVATKAAPQAVQASVPVPAPASSVASGFPDVYSFATKAELPDVSSFATKAELPDVSSFATKDELVVVSELSAKFDNLLAVVSQLNLKLNEANEKIAELEAERSS